MFYEIVLNKKPDRSDMINSSRSRYRGIAFRARKVKQQLQTRSLGYDKTFS
jgi:hypothetical protein